MGRCWTHTVSLPAVPTEPRRPLVRDLDEGNAVDLLDRVPQRGHQCGSVSTPA